MKKILLVDDEKIKRIKLGRTLKSKGFSVKECKNGVEALETMLKENFDLLIIDSIMPKMNGFDTCKMMIEKNIAPKTKTIMLLGYGKKEDYPELTELGVKTGISKPVKSAELFSAIANTLGH